GGGGSFGTSWGYDWARNDKDGLSESKFYAPMQHRQGWPNLGTLHKKRHDWNNDHKMNVLLGFNEPDRPDQANMGVDKAVELWPRLMDLDIPLVSPACSLGGESWWLSSWNNKISNKGYRCEYAGAHWYSGPSSTNLLNYIDTVQSAAGGKPVWLTEFSVVDWSNGNGDWSEETNYNFILEFLWRAEAKNNLRKYAIFIFSGGAPTNPWDKTNPRSNFRKNDGSLHPFGKAYAAWDGDKTIRTQQPYLIHNRNARHRIRNSGSGNPTPSWIRREDDSVQWYLEEAGTDKVYLTSIVDNTRLRYSGGTLDFAPALTTGPEVEWTYNKEQYGWHNIIHPQTGQYLRLHRENNASSAPTSQEFQMVSAAAASGYSSTDWWFVKPHNPSTITSPDSNGSYEAWALSHGLPTSTPDADPDLDGLTNLAEHAFLTDPNKKTPSVLTINQDDHLSFRLNTANPNLTWSLQTSTDLGDNDPWTSVPYTVESSGPQPYGSTLMTLSPNSISPPQYFRLEISLAP
ncbi:MAG: glycosyl hydrolase, partial [Akkermansiaceae bacterium]